MPLCPPITPYVSASIIKEITPLAQAIFGGMATKEDQPEKASGSYRPQKTSGTIESPIPRLLPRSHGLRPLDKQSQVKHQQSSPGYLQTSGTQGSSLICEAQRSTADNTAGSIEHPNPRYFDSISGGDSSWVHLDEAVNKTIIIMGRTGVGKAEIAKHIFKNSSHKFPEFGSVQSVTRQARLIVHDDNHNLTIDGETITFRVIIMDTKGLSSPSFNFSNILQKISDVGPVHAVFFVLKYGRVTSEDCRPLNNIMHGLKKTDGFGSICHLIITGCEGQDKAGRNDVIQLYRRDPLTSEFCTFVRNIVPVGFPDLTSVIPALRELYKECIREDEDKLKDILKKSHQQLTLQYKDLNAAVMEFNCPIF